MEKGYFRFEVQHINRDTKNIVASASYRSDEELYSERTDEQIKFRNHVVKPESMILTPENAPSWANSRERLWNEVDKVEKQNTKTENPQLATEILLSLPNDLDREVQTELAKDFVQTEFVDKGMVADISIHRDDSNNPHAHVLLTQRPFNQDGTWGSKTKTRTQYDENGNPKLNKNGNKIRKQERFSDIKTVPLRKSWEEKLNFFAERENSQRRYDSRNFEEQGKEKIAQIRLSREEYRIEEKEKKRCEKQGIEYEPITYYGKINQEIIDYNNNLTKEISHDENQIKKQNAFNDLVETYKPTYKNDEDYNNIKARYKHDVGYIEAKETIRNMHETASTFGRKIMNEKLKLDLKEQYLDYIVNEKIQGNDISKYGFDKDRFNEPMQKKYNELAFARKDNEAKESKRSDIYNSAKNILMKEKQANENIVSNIYPNRHDKFTDDEKAFIVENGFKGEFLHVSKVEKAFKENSEIPKDIDIKELYTKVSKDIFFSERNIKNAEQNDIDDIMTQQVEKAFIDSKLNELNKVSHFIEDDLMNKLESKNYEKVKDESIYSKTQLIISLDKYDKVSQEEIINKHLKQNENEQHENRNNQEKGNRNIEHNESSKQNLNLDVTNILSQYVQGLEQSNTNGSKKKKKKRNKDERENDMTR
ncbi:MobA/MobL family protein [Staphylococcus xylosus]|uniref:MobA/MobL family protein n=1 Tax=Staphylococcus xylosus TaxID=1288 RepID=A0AAQ0LWQ3_STAXY|nr:MobA/MobL family protein [Staphylococcus xylosus]RIM91003.1 MobA/MobL family protein [Staphylococcus xylosus]